MVGKVPKSRPPQSNAGYPTDMEQEIMKRMTKRGQVPQKAKKATSNDQVFEVLQWSTSTRKGPSDWIKNFFWSEKVS